LFYIAYRFFKSLTAPGQTGKKKKGAGGEEMVKDPQCGVFIPRSDGIVRKVGGERHVFCSTECYKKYKEKGDAG